MANLVVRPLPLSEIVEHVRAGDGFSLARISDGAFFCLWEPVGRNCDGVVYSQAQSEALIDCMRNPAVTHGITSIAIHRARASEWLNEHGIDVEWYDAEAMHKSSETGQLWPLIEAMRERKVVLVGPAHLWRLSAFPVLRFIECHPTQAFEQVAELYHQIAGALNDLEPDVLLLSVGQAAAPTLASWLAGVEGLTVLDMGSIWDMYVGVLSRSGPKRMGREHIEELGRQNFRMEIGAW